MSSVPELGNTDTDLVETVNNNCGLLNKNNTTKYCKWNLINHDKYEARPE